MQTTTTIKAYAYPVKIKDHRSGVSNSDTIVIPAEWLRICGSMGLEICDDKNMIHWSYNRKGYEVIEIGNRRKITFTVDLERLYAEQVIDEIKSQTFGIFEVAANGLS